MVLWWNSRSDGTGDTVESNHVPVAVSCWIVCMNGKKEKRGAVYHRVPVAAEL